MYWNKAVERYTQVIEADRLFYDDTAMDVEKNRETINNIRSFLSMERSGSITE